MKLAPALLATSAMLLLGGGGTARAGGYVSLGIGADANLSGDLAAHFTTEVEEGGSARIALGQRIGRLSFEVGLGGADIASTTALGGQELYSATTIGVTGKYYFPLSGRLEAFGKGGLEKTWLLGDEGAAAGGYSGRGYNLGGGLEYSFQAILLGRASIWLDYTHQAYTLTATGKRDLDGGAQLVTAGVSIGF